MFPGATTAVIGGSTGRGERTESSDIDLLLLGDNLFADGRASHAGTYEFEDEIFEVFAYTAAGFEEWAQRGIEQHRPVIVHMLAEGQAVRTGEGFADLRRRWSAIMDAWRTGDDPPGSRRERTAPRHHGTRG